MKPSVQAQAFLKPKMAPTFYGRHPWVFDGSFEKIVGKPADGDIVELVSNVGNFIAYGLYNSRSKIRLRLYSWNENELLDQAFFERAIDRAIALRHDLLKLNSQPNAAYRVVFSEADILSGLIVDRYDDWLSVQISSLALSARQGPIVDYLLKKLGCRGALLRSDPAIAKLEGLELADGLLAGEMPPHEVQFMENDLKFAVNLHLGQKTGYFLDQRDNRKIASQFCHGKTVLDTFCYAGGFGLYATQAGAAEVECVDSSAFALELAKRNAELNGFDSLSFVKADVFDHLDQRLREGRKYDVIILDPPKFARNRSAIPEAMRGYRRLHQIALRLLNPNGILVSCCCTGVITLEMLEDVIAQVAGTERKQVQLIERRGPAADHPVATGCRETGYLKCIIALVN